jgi:hypothetical protein
MTARESRANAWNRRACWAATAFLAVVMGCPPAPPASPGAGTGQDSDTLPDACTPQEAELNLVEVPDPLSGDNPTYKLMPAAVPAPGESVPDARLGLAQTRVTETAGLRHEYSRHDPFNVDQTLLVLMYIPAGEWRVYRTQSPPYDGTGRLVRTLDMEEPRWDRADPDLIWGLQGFRIVTQNVQTGETTTVKDFTADPTVGPLIAAQPDLYRITTKDEGESSTDRRFWVFMIQGANEDYRSRYIVTWDRQTDQVPGLYTLPAAEANIDWVGMSPKGTWVLIGGDFDNGGNLAGLTLADRELTTFQRLDYTTAHADVGLDFDGQEVIVMQNTVTDRVDLIPLDPATQPILDAGTEYAGTNRTPLVRLFYNAESPLGLNSGVHISCNVPGYCVISTNIAPGLPEQNWLDCSIILVELNRQEPRAFYLAKVYGTTGAYWEETQASITNDGAKVVWATNWNQDVGQEKVWVMELDMPAGWSAALGD